MKNKENLSFDNVDNKPIFYFNYMEPPLYVRLVSEKLQLDHIVNTDSTEKVLSWNDLQTLSKTDIFEKIIIYLDEKRDSVYLVSNVDEGEDEITYVRDQWINLFDVILVDSASRQGM